MIATIDEIDLLRRLRNEFDALPHMRLTCGQAARLIDVDDAVCASSLNALIAVGYLVRQGQTYSRAEGCRY